DDPYTWQGDLMTLRTLIAALLAFTVSALHHPAHSQSSRAPLITGTPSVSVQARTLYHFLPATQAQDGQKLTYSTNWKPEWASCSTSAGRLTGQPGVAHIGRTPDIVISASNGVVTSSLPAFSITVTAGATPPVSAPPTNPGAGNPGAPPAPTNPPPASN